MSTTPIDLYNGQPGATAEELYECPTVTKVFVTAACACNDTTTADYVTLYRVPSGDSAGDANIIYNQETVANMESKALPNLVGQVLEPGDKLYGLIGTANRVTLHISGVARV